MSNRRLPEGLRRQMEADPTRMIPYAGHILPHTVLTMDNSALAVIHLHGLPYELLSMDVRKDRRERINTLLRRLADSNRTICFHMVRHLGASPPPQPKTDNEFVQELMESYNRAILAPGMVYRNDWFISVLVRQPSTATSRWKKLLEYAPTRKSTAPLGLTEDAHRTLEDVVQVIMTTLSDYQPRRLGLTENPTEDPEITIPVTEIGTALHLIRTAHLVPIPHTTGSLASAIYCAPVVVERRYFNLNLPDIKRVGAMVSFNNYPARPRVGMFNELLSTPYPSVMSHTFQYRSAGAAVSSMRLIKQQMENAHDAAKDLSKGVEDAANATASMKTGSGRHHFGLAVYAETEADLDRNVADATNRLSKFGGAAPIRETNVWYSGALESAYYLQLPGCRAFKPRPATLSTLDLASMASLDNFPTGDAKGYWGSSPIRFLTNGMTTYDYITHDEDVGHFGVYGRIGAGKTAFLGMLIAALDPVMGENGIRLVIDKDESNKLAINACGGAYTTLLRNRPSGLAPLVAFQDSPETRAFLHRLYTWLIVRDGRGPISNDEDGRLARGIARQLQMPPEQRSMGGVREFLGYYDRENGAGARFERWLAGNSMGWLLDNRKHVIRLGAGLYGFDFTSLIPKEGQDDDGACSVAAAVIMHQLAGLMDGRRIACFCDESRFYMEPLKQMIEDYSLTGRKKELMLGLLAQQPEHHTDTAMGLSLVQQMRTKFIFPDASLDVATLRDKLKISPAAIRMLKTDMTLGTARRFLLWRPSAPAICEFDLSALPQLPILSGRPKTIRLMESVHGDMAEFHRRLEKEAA